MLNVIKSKTALDRLTQLLYYNQVCPNNTTIISISVLSLSRTPRSPHRTPNLARSPPPSLSIRKSSLDHPANLNRTSGSPRWCRASVDTAGTAETSAGRSAARWSPTTSSWNFLDRRRRSCPDAAPTPRRCRNIWQKQRFSKESNNLSFWRPAPYRIHLVRISVHFLYDVISCNGTSSPRHLSSEARSEPVEAIPNDGLLQQIQKSYSHLSPTVGYDTCKQKFSSLWFYKNHYFILFQFKSINK